MPKLTRILHREDKFFPDFLFANRTEDIRNIIAYHVTSSLCARVALQTRYVKTN